MPVGRIYKIFKVSVKVKVIGNHLLHQSLRSCSTLVSVIVCVLFCVNV